MGDAQAAPLADCEKGHALVAAQNPALGVGDVPRAGRGQAGGGQKPGVVAVGNKAEVHALGLVGGAQAQGAGYLAGLRLGEAAQGHERSGELALGERKEKVTLVLAAVGAAQEAGGAALRAVLDPGVMAGGDIGGAQLEGPAHEGAELDRSS